MNASFECIEKHLYRRRRVIDAVLRYFHRLEKEAAHVPAWIRSQGPRGRARAIREHGIAALEDQRSEIALVVSFRAPGARKSS